MIVRGQWKWEVAAGFCVGASWLLIRLSANDDTWRFWVSLICAYGWIVAQRHILDRSPQYRACSHNQPTKQGRKP